MDETKWTELAAATQRGDTESFRELVESATRVLIAIAFRYTQDWESARDLTQETWIKVHRGIRRYDPDAVDSLVIQAVRSVFVEWDEFDETADEMDLMGVVLATVLDLTLRVDIPGRIVETNADRREEYSDPLAGRQILVWDIDPASAVTNPIEIYVKSEIPNR